MSTQVQISSSANARSILMATPGSPIANQSDGVGVLTDSGGSTSAHDGVVAVSNGFPARTLDPAMLCEVMEDFIGKALNVTDSVWATHDTSAAGSPTLAIKADSDNGAFEMAFDSQSEAQVLGLLWNDEQNIDSDQGAMFHCRLQIPVALLSVDTLAFGLTTARNSTWDSVANHASFRLDGVTMALKLESDDGTTDNDDKVPDQAPVLVAGTYYEFFIDASNVNDVKFYYRATLGGDWTALTLVGVTFKIGADVALQPNIQLQKASGAGTTSILVDFVRVLWRRN